MTNQVYVVAILVFVDLILQRDIGLIQSSGLKSVAILVFVDLILQLLYANALLTPANLVAILVFVDLILQQDNAIVKRKAGES